MVRNMSTKYLLDTSVLIQAQQSYYAFEIAPVFWKHLDDQSQRGTIRSIDKVRNEIRFFNKPLGNWAKNKFKRWESTDNKYTKQRHRKLIEWSTSSTHYNQRAKNLFADMSKADAWLIAHAWANQYTVVTQEGRDDGKKREMPIPNACLAFDVPYIHTFQMLRDLGLNLSEITTAQKQLTDSSDQ